MRNGNKFTMNTPNTEKLGDLLSQLGGILGVGRRSDGKYYLADMCTASSINMWAYYKPIKANTQANLTNAERIQAKHGLKQNSSTFYIEYDKPSSGWWKRLRDFNGYNHQAVPPIKDTTKFNNTISFSGGSSGQIVFSPDDLRNPSAELALNEIAIFQTYANYYVGVMFYNKASGKGYYHTYEWTLNQIVNGEASASESVGTDAEAPNIEDGVTYDMYYCLAVNKNQRYKAFTSAAIGSSLWVLCCDATHGHASVKAIKMGWDYINVVKPDIYCSYRGYGSAIIQVTNVTIKCSWNFSAYPNTNEKMIIKAEIGDESITPISPEKYIVSAETDFALNGQVEISADDVVDYYGNLVPIYIYGKFGTESSYKTLGYGVYDVVNKDWERWYSYI